MWDPYEPSIPQDGIKSIEICPSHHMSQDSQVSFSTCQASLEIKLRG